MSIIKTSAELSFLDRLGSFKVRWGIGRHVYLIEPGLYALGEPDKTSPVIVTANYKYTFDIVRSCLAGHSLYILVLDTKGVNVWCAAGKGTFGTEELIKRIQAADLASVIEHKTIILPQLGAVGVAAHQIKKATGFQVAYGPVRAEDLSEYLKNEMKASPDMRQVRFTLWDRLVLVPVELVTYFLPSLMAAVILLLVSTIHPTGIFFTFREAGEIFLNVFIAYLGGVALTPILLPWIPVRSFSGKGAISGLLLVAAMGLLRTPWLFIMPAISSFLAMNFTGSSTYTSLSGVKKEMKVAVPLQLAVIIMGAIGLIVSHFI